MNAADIVFPQREDGERTLQYMRRATQYTRLGTPDVPGDLVKIRPTRQHYVDAEHGPVPCTVGHMVACIQSHKADKLRNERFISHAGVHRRKRRINGFSSRISKALCLTTG